MSQKEKIIITIIVIAIVALLIVIGALVWRGLPGGEKAGPAGEERAAEDKTAAEKTKDLIAEIKEIAEKTGESKGESIAKVITVENGESEGEQAVIAAPGTNPISVDDGEVIDIFGRETRNEAMAGSADAPSQSQPINPDDLPSSAVKLLITPVSITPAEFRVKAGQVVLLSATAAGESVEAFVFSSPKLEAVSIGLSPGETRAITFKAPLETGEYAYFSNIIGHRAAGAEGKMIVE